MSNICTVHQSISTKITKLRELCTYILKTYTLEEYDENMICDFDINIGKIENIYFVISSSIFIRYESYRTELYKELYNEYYKKIISAGIIHTLDKIYDRCKKILCSYKFDNIKELTTKVKHYDSIVIDIKDIYINSGEICNCGNIMVIDEKSYELVCNECGFTNKLSGEIFEEEHIYFQEGNRSKPSNYVAIKHCRKWMLRIQGLEKDLIPSEVISSILFCMKRDNVFFHMLTCQLIRMYLKERGHTNYNSHCAKIKKSITGKDPPKFTSDEDRDIITHFNDIILIYFDIIPSDKTNFTHYPYYLYKIIEQVIKDKHKREEILLSIYIQDTDTITRNDCIWKEICIRRPVFTYIPTIVKTSRF